jgi:predicted KAP-like P-loop ATPase
MSNADNTTNAIRGDRAIGSVDEDRLGFRQVAKRIAVSLVDRASEDGLVIGLEGSWGSGKSSILFLISDELGQLPTKRRPAIINFRPWLIGNRDALITSLFGELSKHLDLVALNGGDAGPMTVAKAKEAGNALRRFVSALSTAGSAIEFAGEASGLASIKLIAKAIKAFEGVGKKTPESPQLVDLKNALAKSLKELGHRFVICIDDVDRLEPAEAIEMLRLVRSVVDLPNLTYLLCYDSEILVHSIEKAVGVKNGHSYLEKIVQLTVMVPKPEPFQLRQWFSDDLHLIASAQDDEGLSRLKQVIDFEGGRRLLTPRSVVRTLDAIRFFWPPLREMQADLADLVWVQLIKNANPALYRWIEEYSATAALVSLGTAQVSDAEKQQSLAGLIDTVESHFFDDIHYRYAFAEQLPGIDADYSEGTSRFTIYNELGEQDRNESIRKRRLSSPDHYRLYFASAGPSHALNQEDYQSTWAALDAGVEQGKVMLFKLSNVSAGGSLTKADLLLERVKTGASDVLSPQQCENLLMTFSKMMDEAYRRRPFDIFSLNSLWDRAEKLIPVLLNRIKSEHRPEVITSMFKDGEAISWLTSVLRRETFAHGRYGNRRRKEIDWRFTEAQLDQITELMLARYRIMSVSEVFGCLNPIDILFAWAQGGDAQGPRNLVMSAVGSDEGLIQTLEHLVSTIDSSDRGRYDVLKEENLSPFMSFDQIVKRIEALQDHHDLGTRAKRLAVAIADGAEA